MTTKKVVKSIKKKPKIDMMVQLMQKVYVVGAEVRFFNALRKLKAQELGLKNKDVSYEFVVLGQKRLIPAQYRKRFASFSSKVQYVYKKLCRQYMAKGLHLVTYQNLLKFRNELEKIKEEYELAVDEFVEEYPKIRKKMLAFWKDYLDEKLKSVNVNGEKREEYFQDFKKLFPKSTEIRSKFKFNYFVVEFQYAKPVSRKKTTKRLLKKAELEEEALKKMKKDLDAKTSEYLEEVFTLQRQELNEAIAHTLNVIKEKGTFPSKTQNALRKYFVRWKSAMIMPDEMKTDIDAFIKNVLSESNESINSDTKKFLGFKSALKELSQTAKNITKQETITSLDSFCKFGQRKIL